MKDNNVNFWNSLLNMATSRDERIRLWNGYVGQRVSSTTSITNKGQHYGINLANLPPDVKWPKLSKTETDEINLLAAENDGHPEFNNKFMDFGNHTFQNKIDFSDLILINSSFSQAQFTYIGEFRNTQFFGRVDFQGTIFEKQCTFDGAQFIGLSDFTDSQFYCGCSFKNATFEAVWFNNAKFLESGFPTSFCPEILVDFRNVQFRSLAHFDEAKFGTPYGKLERRVWPERVVDFSGTCFKARTSFRNATIAGVPAFFEASLHEDTDLDSVHWDRVAADRTRSNYAVRAWERLELIMSQLEKPLDRHRFFRFKMRARRRMDGHLLKAMNWIFEFTSDYGWGIQRALLTWLIHWTGFALVMILSAAFQPCEINWWKTGLAALATGFANAHAFLGLNIGGGYLATSRQLLERLDSLGLLPAVEIVQTVLEPIVLFLLLLTIRNRFRLA